MKKIKRFIFLLIIMFITTKVNAATTLSATNQSPVVGTNFDVHLYIDYGESKISSAHYAIDYDSNCFAFSKVEWTQGTNNIQNSDGKIYIDKPETTRAWQKGIPVILTFKTMNTCRSNFKLEVTGDATFLNGRKVPQTTSGVTINSIQGDTNNELSQLLISGFDISPTFQRSTKYYTLTVPSNTSEIEIKTKKMKENQTIEGDGKRKLEYGDNRIDVKVKSQSGSENIYQIMVTRTDDRTSDTSLKALNVSNTNIRLDKDKTTFSATVGKSTKEIFISATANNPQATLVGTGKKELDIGENTFEIKVTSNDDTTQIYKFNITRSEKEIEPVTQSTKLNEIKYFDKTIKIDKDKNTYLIGVDHKTKSIELETIPTSPTSVVTFEGNENLQNGINLIKITVTEINNETEDYKLLVYKKPNDKVNNINEKDDKTIKIENKKSTFNIVNDYEGLLYQVKINNKENEEINVEVKKIEDDSLTYTTEAPEKSEITMFIGNELYLDDTLLNIYSYDEDGQYKIISDGTMLQNGYIKFTTDGSKNFIITTQKLVIVENFLTKATRILKIVLIVLIVIIIISIVGFKIYHKKMIEKNKNEPLY